MQLKQIINKLVFIVILTLSALTMEHLMNSYNTQSEKLSAKPLTWDLKISLADYGRKKQGKDSDMYNPTTIPDRSSLDNNTGTQLTRHGEPVMFFVNGGGGGNWGMGGNPLGGQRTDAPLPDKLHLVFIDNFDNYQLYQLEVDLPLAQMQELLTTVHRGLTDYSQLENGRSPNVYTGFELGFAPNGWVIFYATGIGLRKELASWQAKKINVSPEVLDDITYGYGTKIRKGEFPNYAREALEKSQPEIYRRIESGEFKFTSDWYKKMQTKFPWNLEINGDNAKWTGEYYMEFANTEHYPILSDQIESNKKALKAVPTKIVTWMIDKSDNKKYYIEIHPFPMPKWMASDYIPYYQDPNLNYFFKRFEYFYPTRTLSTNNQPAKPKEFAILKIHLNEDGIMDEIYLQKGSEKLPIEGAYEYRLAEVDAEQGGYYANPEATTFFITEPKIKDLSDPLFVDLD